MPHRYALCCVCSRLHPEGGEALLPVHPQKLPPEVSLCGKMDVLDRMLVKLIAAGHKVGISGPHIAAMCNVGAWNPQHKTPVHMKSVWFCMCCSLQSCIILCMKSTVYMVHTSVNADDLCLLLADESTITTPTTSKSSSASCMLRQGFP